MILHEPLPMYRTQLEHLTPIPLTSFSAGGVYPAQIPVASSLNFPYVSAISTSASARSLSSGTKPAEAAMEFDFLVERGCPEGSKSLSVLYAEFDGFPDFNNLRNAFTRPIAHWLRVIPGRCDTE